MSGMDKLNQITFPKLDERLRAHLSALELSKFSRLPAERLERTALPNIGLVELVDGDEYQAAYEQLYMTNFHAGERERPDLIVTRLRDEFTGKRDHLQPYRVVGVRDHSGDAIGAVQFSTLFLKDGERAVPFVQYIYVREANRRQDLSELMHTLVLAIAVADAARRDSKRARHVPFTLMETEPPVHGIDESKRANAAMRTQIHTRSGSFAMMMRRRSDGGILSAHVQPGLEMGEPPLTYVWAVRVNPAVGTISMDNVTGELAIAAYYQSLRDEGFPEENIALAERLVAGRARCGVEFCLLQLGEITKDMYIGIDAAEDH